MFNMEPIMKRVEAWNAARYEREFNLDLAIALLTEEHKEWLDAETPVDELDALCDKIYVALGVIWKLNISNAENNYSADLAHHDVYKLMETNTLMPAYLVSSVINSVGRDSEYSVLYGMHMIIKLCLTQMTAMGLEPKHIFAALLTVCESNDSKQITKTASDIKANQVKGISYIPPEPKLQSILDSVIRSKF